MQVGQEEYNNFFKTTFREFLDPLAQAHFSVEGTIEFSALLFIPGMAPFEQQVIRVTHTKPLRWCMKVSSVVAMKTSIS